MLRSLYGLFIILQRIRGLIPSIDCQSSAKRGVVYLDSRVASPGDGVHVAKGDREYGVYEEFSTLELAFVKSYIFLGSAIGK